MADAIAVRIQAKTSEVESQLKALERDHFPFALAKTLTEVSNLAVQAVRAETRQKFDLKTEFIPRGISRTYAKKSDVRNKGVGTTVVFTKPVISGWMPVHETGGTRTPHGSGSNDKGQAFTVPGRDIGKYSTKTATGATRKRWKAKELLKAYSGRRLPASVYAQVVQGRVLKRKSDAFIIKGRASGVPMIVRRLTSERMPLEILYVFTRRATYKGVWDFAKTVEDVVDDKFETLLKHNVYLAVNQL